MSDIDIDKIKLLLCDYLKKLKKNSSCLIETSSENE